MVPSSAVTPRLLTGESGQVSDHRPQPVREGPGRSLVFAGGPDQGEVQLRGGEELRGALADQTLIGDDGGAGRRPVGGLVFAHLPGLVALPGQLRVGQAEPAQVPSQVQISVSLDPQYQREWLGQ